jgi:sugar/nucleoside kinase (ribokinase family)
MLRPDEVRALVIGAVSRDRHLGQRDRADRPGGVATYAGLAWARLGARTRVLTRVAPADVPWLLASLEAAGAEVMALPSAATTVCANDYDGPTDRHVLLSTSDPVTAADVPEAWRDAHVVQLGPLHPDDIDPAVPSVLRGRVAIDLQGVLRALPGRPAPTIDALEPWLRAADVVQVSQDETAWLGHRHDPAALCRAYGVSEFLITRGALGAEVVTAAGGRRVATEPVDGGDPTGAGDVFLAGYLFARETGAEPLEAARRACALAAAHVAAGAAP